MLKVTFSLCALLSIAFCGYASDSVENSAANENQVIEKEVPTSALANNEPADDMETFPKIEEQQILAEGCGCGKGKNKNAACCGEEELEQKDLITKLACGRCGGKHFFALTTEEEAVRVTTGTEEESQVVQAA